MLYGVFLSYDSDAAQAVDTLQEYGLALALDGLKISAPKVRTEYKEIRGRDGALDASDSPQGYPTYEPRPLTFRLFHDPPFTERDVEELLALRTEFAARWQGRRVRITLPDDDAHYWLGRLSIADFEAGTYTIDCEAVVYPYKLANEETVVTIDDLTTSWQTYTLDNARRYVVPVITIGQDTDIQLLQGPLGVPPVLELELPSGETSASFRLPDALLVPGENLLRAKIGAAGTNSLTITYREGIF